MFINGLKYACSTCIKGHRSSHCSHVDRPLFEIRKKGRPVTQCTFCRDLRKTKQVHIKCACSDKKGSENNTTLQQQQPLLIYRSNSQSNPGCSSNSIASPIAADASITLDDVCQDKKSTVGANNKQCTCPSTAAAAVAATKATPMVRSSSGSSYLSHHQSPPPQQQQQQQHAQVTQDTTTQMNVTRDTLLAPLCPTVPSVKEENLSYSWALITSPSANQVELPNTSAPSTQLFTEMMMDHEDENNNNNNNNSNNINNLHLGFIFHKPTASQRFLDGQPRTRRRRSTKRNAATVAAAVTPNRLPINALVDSVLTVDTLTEYSLSTPPSSAVSPHPPSSNSSAAAACEPMDIQFDYLTEQLEILSNSNHTTDNFMGDLANAEELTAILNNVLSKDDMEEGGSVSTANSHRSSVSTTVEPMVINPVTTPSQMIPNNTTNNMNRSHCGSFVPRSKCCKPLGATGGESVVITITPLNTSNTNTENIDKQQQQQHQLQYPTTTRIVTCYCGSQCTCPGCLVHPGNFFLGSDPYSGPLIPSSSASSSCYGSDEEDTNSNNTTTVNNAIFTNNGGANNFMPFS